MYLYYIRLKLIGDERYSVFNLEKKKVVKIFGKIDFLIYIYIYITTKFF
jgi:hypothetical protein